MKKLYTFLILIILAIASISYSSADYSCDQTFQSVKLRKWFSYGFNDSYVNPYLSQLNSFSVSFTEQWDINWASNPSFNWTSEVVNQNYLIQPNTNTKIISWVPRYDILYNPVRRQSDNIYIKYTLQYREKVNWVIKWPYFHTECQPYEITWCWDGIKDNYTDPTWFQVSETCDPADPSKSGWGTGWCHPTTCQPIVSDPVCKGITVDPNKGQMPLDVNVGCTWTFADTITIDCGNWVTQDFTWNKSWDKTVNKVCKYTTAKTYTPVCKVNWQTPIRVCQWSVEVTAPTPSIQIVKTDLNTADKDGTVENDTQTVVKWSDAIFKITVTNNGTEDLKNIVLTDTIAPNCAWSVTLPSTKPATFQNFQVYGSGNNGDNLLQPWEKFSYTCKKWDTQNNYTNTADVSAKWNVTGDDVNATDPTQVKVVDPVCESLTVDPSESNVTFTSNFVCKWKYADKYKIEVKNSAWTVIKTISQETWSHSFATAWDYTVSCYINDKTTTEQACIKPIKANAAPVPSILIQKFSTNSNDRDWDKRHTPADDSQTIYKWGDSVFKIRVTNNGTENLNNIVLTDTLAPNCWGNVVLPNTKPSTFSNFVVWWNWNNTNNVLEPGEYFEYTCSKSNIQANYTNTAKVDAKWVTSTDPVTSNDPTDIKVVEPVCNSLTVTSDSGNVAFTSSFTCAWTEVDTYKILVKDSSWAVLQSINSNVWQYNFTTSGSYSVECYMNEKTTTEDACKKTITANSNVEPKIAIDKVDANASLDKDWVIWNDTQTLVLWDKAVFKIRVTNNWTESLKEINLVDAIAPSCSGSVTLPDTKPASFLTFSIAWSGDHTDSVLEAWEYFEYTCEKDNTQSTYTNSATVNAKWNSSNRDVTATDTTLVNTSIYDLALIKKVVNPKTSYSSWETVTFEITTYNQWTIDANDVIITDYIPTWLTLQDTSWTQSGSLATRNIWTIPKWQNGEVTNKAVTITFKISAISWDILNWAEISSDNWDDIDSTTDQNNTDCNWDSTTDRTRLWNWDDYILWNAKLNACWTQSWDEDDHDWAKITVSQTPVYTCTNLDASAISWNVSFTSNFTCNGTNASSYKIELKDSTWNLVYTSTTSTWAYNFANTGTYTAICYVNNETTQTNSACVKTITASTWGGGWGGGWNSPICEDTYILSHTPSTWRTVPDSAWHTKIVSFSGSSLDVRVLCDWNWSSNQVKIDCWNWTSHVVPVNSNNERKWEATCSYTSQNTYKIKCEVSPDLSWWNAFVWSLACHADVLIWNWTPWGWGGGWWADPSCWNGIVETWEECDFWTRNWNFWVKCSTSCDYNKTVPTWWDMTFYPSWKVIMWGQYLFDYPGQTWLIDWDDIYIKNTWTWANLWTLKFDLPLCIYKKTPNDNIVTPNIEKYCNTTNVWYIFPWETKKLNIRVPYKWNTIAATANWSKSELNVTLEWHQASYFASKLDITVVKPTIITTWGWTTYLNKQVWNVAESAKTAWKDSIADKNKNFVSTVLWPQNDLSFVKTVTDTNKVAKTANEWTKYSSWASNIVKSTWNTTNWTGTLNDVKSYNWMSDVFILKDKSLKIDSSWLSRLQSITIPTTYIVENGNLEILTNIKDIPQNIAFVVKWWNIIVDKNVNALEWTYITIPWTVWGKVMSNWENNTSTLKLSWTIYWDLNNLIDNRTFVKEEAWKISVWTVVNFGSSLLKKPAPLISRFIWEYMDATKTAK